MRHSFTPGFALAACSALACLAAGCAGRPGSEPFARQDVQEVHYDDSYPDAPVYSQVPVIGDAAPFNPQERRGFAVIRRDQQFEDIPVPLGFRLRRDKMFSFQGSALRYGKFVYEGNWTFRRTRNFYTDQMAVHGWELVRVNDKYPPRGEIQRYRRGHELAEITLRRRDTSVIQAEVVVRDSRRPDPGMLAEARLNAAPAAASPPSGPGAAAVVVTGQPYRAPLYVGDSVPGAVALSAGGANITTYSDNYNAASTPAAPAPPPEPVSAPAEFDMERPLRPFAAPRPAVRRAAPAAFAEPDATMAQAPGMAVYRREGVTRRYGSPIPFDTIQGKAVDPQTFQINEPAGLGIVVQ